MDVIALLHRLAEWLVPARAASLAILVAVFATLLPGVRRRRTGSVEAPGLALLALGALPALAPWPWTVNAVLLVVVLVLSLLQERHFPDGGSPMDVGPTGVRASMAVGAATAVMALFVLPELGTYAGRLLIWEGEVVAGFAEAFRDHTSVLRYLGDCFLWTNGVVAEGHASLVYGGLTYPVLLRGGFSTWTLRVVAAVCGLLSAPVMYLLARRWFGRPAALLAAAAWAVSSTVLLYARYGTSLSATLATLLLATLATEVLRTRGGHAWWPAPLAVCALGIASLHYAPGRLVVVLLLAAAAGHLLRSVGRLSRSGAAGAALALALLAAFVGLQLRHGRAGQFLNAHGEQVLGILQQPDDAARYLGRPARGGPARAFDAASLGAALVRRNLPDLGPLVGVVARSGPPEEPGMLALREDPPKIPLYFVPLLPFLVFGAAVSLRRWRSWPHGLLLAWIGVTVGASLLSNRIDHHRLVTLCVPVCMWLGSGLWLGLGILRRAGLPRAARTALVAALLGAALLEATWSLNVPRPVTPAPLVVTAARALAGIAGRVTAALIGDERDRAAVELLLVERERVLRVRQGQQLPPRVSDALLDQHKRSRLGEEIARGLGEATARSTLLLGPVDDTVALALRLESLGYVVRRVTGPVDLFVVTAPPGGVKAP
jgi:4-amino-4-deoxy-L-arabinose transferase-like glycosyltransferase